MFSVVAILDGKPGKEKELEEALRSLVPLTRKEDGCIDYHLHQSLGTPTRFLFYENWKSKEVWLQHLEMPYIKEFFAKAEDLLAVPVDIEQVQYEMLSDWSRRE